MLKAFLGVIRVCWSSTSLEVSCYFPECVSTPSVVSCKHIPEVSFGTVHVNFAMKDADLRSQILASRGALRGYGRRASDFLLQNAACSCLGFCSFCWEAPPCRIVCANLPMRSTSSCRSRFCNVRDLHRVWIACSRPVCCSIAWIKSFLFDCTMHSTNLYFRPQTWNPR